QTPTEGASAMVAIDRSRRVGRGPAVLFALAVLPALLAGLWAWRASVVSGQEPPAEPFPMPPELRAVDLLRQTAAEASRKSAGCVACHQGAQDPHFKETLHLGCCDCHGGDPSATTKERGHVFP